VLRILPLILARMAGPRHVGDRAAGGRSPGRDRLLRTARPPQAGRYGADRAVPLSSWL